MLQIIGGNFEGRFLGQEARWMPDGSIEIITEYERVTSRTR